MYQPSALPEKRRSARLQKRDTGQDVIEHITSHTQLSAPKSHHLIFPSKISPTNIEMDGVKAPLPISTKLISFEAFEKLPIELRQHIVTFTFPGQRTVEFYSGNDRLSAQFIQDRARIDVVETTLSFLQVNKQYRHFCEKWYTPCFSEYTNNKASVHINFSIDTVILPESHNLSTFFGRSPRLADGQEYIRGIEHLAFPHSYIFEYTPTRLMAFHSLKSVTIVEIPSHHSKYEYGKLKKQFLDKWEKAAGRTKCMSASGIKYASLEVIELSDTEWDQTFKNA